MQPNNKTNLICKLILFFRLEGLRPNCDYKICHINSSAKSNTGCVAFSTISESYSPYQTDYTVIQDYPVVTGPPRSQKASVGSETIGGICGAIILLVVMCCAALFIKKRGFASHQKSSGAATESGCEETNTWKYSSGSNERSDNMTPNSYYSNNDSYSNAYTGANQYPDVTKSGQITTAGQCAVPFQYHYQPNAQSTPHRINSELVKSNRHSQILQDHQHVVLQQAHHQRHASQNSQFNHFNTSQPQGHNPAPGHFYSRSFNTQPRDQPTYQY